jgi:ribokinase
VSTPASADVCVVGSVNLDLVARTARLPAPGETVLGDEYAEHPGGKGLNQAVAAARAGAATALCACVGDDEAGGRLREVARAAGVLDERVRVAAGQATGRALICVSAAQAQNTIVVVPGANMALGADQAVDASRHARVVVAQLEVPADTVRAALSAARAAGAITVLNPSPVEGIGAELLAVCDYVILNEHEAERLGGAAPILGSGARAVIVTRGARGSVHVAGCGRERAVPSVAVEVVDTTAAGDAYCGVFASVLATGGDPFEAMRLASAAGALATTKPGAIPSLPDRRAIDRLLAAHR